MLQYVCDLCGKHIDKVSIRLEGFRSHGKGGILLPEQFTRLDFCSRGCFMEYVRQALRNEG